VTKLKNFDHFNAPKNNQFLQGLMRSISRIMNCEFYLSDLSSTLPNYLHVINMFFVDTETFY